MQQKLTEAIELHGKRQRAGRREGQVHLTISRSGLTRGFNHYLKYGSEFDYHVAHHLLGEEGLSLLQSDGRPRLISVVLPGEKALAAAHPHFSVEDVRSRGDTPNIIGAFLNAWSFGIVRPVFRADKLQVDCGVIFREAIAPDSIKKIEQLSEV